jgi:hypothetical protein
MTYAAIEAYPLTWPPGRPRLHGKEKPLFKVTLGRSVQDVQREVRLLGGTGLIMSTNQQLRKDGAPFARGTVYDVGIAVYFTYKKKQVCFACDRWWSLEGNMRAISLTIMALRGIERWGTGDMVEQAFTGFAQLPAPEQPWQVLGVSSHASNEEIETAYRRLAAEHHPDRGGDEQTMMRINRARDALLDV